MTTRDKVCGIECDTAFNNVFDLYSKIHCPVEPHPLDLSEEQKKKLYEPIQVLFKQHDEKHKDHYPFATRFLARLLDLQPLSHVVSSKGLLYTLPQALQPYISVDVSVETRNLLREPNNAWAMRNREVYDDAMDTDDNAMDTDESSDSGTPESASFEDLIIEAIRRARATVASSSETGRSGGHTLVTSRQIAPRVRVFQVERIGYLDGLPGGDRDAHTRPAVNAKEDKPADNSSSSSGTPGDKAGGDSGQSSGDSRQDGGQAIANGEGARETAGPVVKSKRYVKDACVQP
jgi:hypothetical protein